MVTSTSGDTRQRTPFSQRLFWSIFTIFLGFTACFLMFQYQREREFSEEKLNNVLTSYNYQLYRISQRSQNINEAVASFMEDIPQKELRVTIISSTGNVLFDNCGTDGLGNHNDRSEVMKAKLNKEGFAIRSSLTTGKRYFYSASNIDGYIYRSALPYDPYVKGVLTVNKDFIYFMVLMTIIFFFVLSRFTFSIGKTISKLRDFAHNVERGRVPSTDYVFPNDELGDIAKNIVTLYQMKRRLTQNVSHELKTPVSSIQGYLETILSNPDLSSEKRQFFLERCYSQSTRLTGLLRDISVLNRLDEASEMFELNYVNIAKLTSEIQKECSNDMEERSITSEISIDSNVVVNGNYSLLYSIFRNLFDNAIAYAGDGSKISVKCYSEDKDFYYFSFSDNGVGVPQEHLSRIFERFYRVDKGRSRKIGGTGLGLSIVKNGVNFHRGQISAESILGKGVTFYFTLAKGRQQ